MKHQRGFTLIELVVVMIVLGILAAIAIPKFIDMSIDAHNASAKGVAGALASGASINYASRAAGDASSVAVNSATICTPAVLQGLLTGTTILLSSGAPTDDITYQVAAPGAQDCSGSALNVTCSVLPRGSGVTVASATILCAR